MTVAAKAIKRKNPVTVLRFDPCGRAPLAQSYLPAPEKEVSVLYMQPEEAEHDPWWWEGIEDLPDDAIIMFRPLESISKYDRIEIDCRNWTNRLVMYEELKNILHLSDKFEYDLYTLADELAASRYSVTLVWAIVPFMHMKQHFVRTLNVMWDMKALEKVHSRDERDYPDSFVEVDFLCGDTPHRPFRNPPVQKIEFPPEEPMW